jgi:hypothetical protein
MFLLFLSALFHIWLGPALIVLLSVVLLFFAVFGLHLNLFLFLGLVLISFFHRSGANSVCSVSYSFPVLSLAFLLFMSVSFCFCTVFISPLLFFLLFVLAYASCSGSASVWELLMFKFFFLVFLLFSCCS